MSDPGAPSDGGDGSATLDEAAAIAELRAARAPLFAEQAAMERAPEYLGDEPRHLCCTRARNLMRITPLEAADIATALREVPALRAELPAIVRRTRDEQARLEDTDERQLFDCPLLAGTRCLVHEHAKPIGCLGWHPPPRGLERRASSFTDDGRAALLRRDALNTAVYGPGWRERAIPLALAPVLPALETDGDD